MNPNIWGPSMWLSLHTITLNYPENPSIHDKKAMSDFFTNLQYVLPCQKCSDNYANHLIKFPIENFLGSRDELVEWLIHIHNEVNKQLGKKILSKDIALKKIREQFKTTKTQLTIKNYINKYLKKAILSIIFILLAIYIYKKLFENNKLKGNRKIIKQRGGNSYVNYYRNNY